MKKVILVLALSVTGVLAGFPNLESLFRNGNNPDVKGNYIRWTFRYKDGETEAKIRYYYYFPDKSVQLHQLFYGKENSFKSTYYFRKKLKSLENEPKLFHSILQSLHMNDAAPMMATLKNYSDDLKRNKELMNWEKYQLLNKYKVYLKALKSDETLSEVLNSPLDPETVEQKEKVQEVLKDELIKSDNFVKLVKKDREFVLNAVVGPINISYDNKNHRLKILKFGGDNKIDFYFKNYSLFDGLHEFPEKIVIKKGESEILILTEDIRQGILSSKEYNKLLEKIRKNHTDPLGEIPSLIKL